MVWQLFNIIGIHLVEYWILCQQVAGFGTAWVFSRIALKCSWLRLVLWDDVISLKYLKMLAAYFFNCYRQSRSTPTSGPPKVSARAPVHRSYHFRGVKLKSCIKKIHHNLYISKQANVRIKHADTEGASHKKFGTDARVQ